MTKIVLNETKKTAHKARRKSESKSQGYMARKI